MRAVSVEVCWPGNRGFGTTLVHTCSLFSERLSLIDSVNVMNLDLLNNHLLRHSAYMQRPSLFYLNRLASVTLGFEP